MSKAPQAGWVTMTFLSAELPLYPRKDEQQKKTVNILKFCNDSTRSKGKGSYEEGESIGLWRQRIAPGREHFNHRLERKRLAS